MKIEKIQIHNAIFIIAFMHYVNGSLVYLYPLSGEQVYNILRKAGREDAIPQGRTITNGLAGMAGYVAGISVGIGVPLLLNIDLANTTGFLGMTSNDGNNNNNNNNNNLAPRELCFNSRSLNVDEDDEANLLLDGERDHELNGNEFFDATSSIELPESSNFILGTSDAAAAVDAEITNPSSSQSGDEFYEFNLPTTATNDFELPETIDTQTEAFDGDMTFLNHRGATVDLETKRSDNSVTCVVLEYSNN